MLRSCKKASLTALWPAVLSQYCALSAGADPWAGCEGAGIQVLHEFGGQQGSLKLPLAADSRVCAATWWCLQLIHVDDVFAAAVQACLQNHMSRDWQPTGNGVCLHRPSVPLTVQLAASAAAEG
jgi:hypothetical protein